MRWSGYPKLNVLCQSNNNNGLSCQVTLDGNALGSIGLADADVLTVSGSPSLSRERSLGRGANATGRAFPMVREALEVFVGTGGGTGSDDSSSRLSPEADEVSPWLLSYGLPKCINCDEESRPTASRCLAFTFALVALGSGVTSLSGSMLGDTEGKLDDGRAGRDLHALAASFLAAIERSGLVDNSVDVSMEQSGLEVSTPRSSSGEASGCHPLLAPLCLQSPLQLHLTNVHLPWAILYRCPRTRSPTQRLLPPIGTLLRLACHWGWRSPCFPSFCISWRRMARLASLARTGLTIHNSLLLAVASPATVMATTTLNTIVAFAMFTLSSMVSGSTRRSPSVFRW